jgi:hypothetical protein
MYNILEGIEYNTNRKIEIRITKPGGWRINYPLENLLFFHV